MPAELTLEARWNLRRELEIDLRRQRLEAFKALWALSEPLAKYGRTGPAATATPASMAKLSSDLRHWYFTQGGVFLTDESRDAYFSFQDAIQNVIHGADKDQELDEETREQIRKRAVCSVPPFELPSKGSHECEWKANSIQSPTTSVTRGMVRQVRLQ